MSEADATNPVEGEPVEGAPEEGVETEATADQPEVDEDGNPVEPEEPPEETEEVEHEGKTYAVPKALVARIMKDADYTQKTQAVAEQRRALESRQAEINQTAAAQAQTFENRVQLAQLDAALDQYKSLNWTDYIAQHGSDNAVAAQAQWRQLEAARADLQKEITDKESEHRLVSERATATAIQEANEVLAREVEGYGSQLVSDVMSTAGAFGFSPEELRDSFVGADGKADTRTFKLLAELTRLRTEAAKTQAQQKKAQTAQKVAAVKPAATVKPNAGQYKPGLSDDLPPDEWLRRRNAEAAKANARPRFAR